MLPPARPSISYKHTDLSSAIPLDTATAAKTQRAQRVHEVLNSSPSFSHTNLASPSVIDRNQLDGSYRAVVDEIRAGNAGANFPGGEDAWSTDFDGVLGDPTPNSKLIRAPDDSVRHFSTKSVDVSNRGLRGSGSSPSSLSPTPTPFVHKGSAGVLGLANRISKALGVVQCDSVGQNGSGGGEHVRPQPRDTSTASTTSNHLFTVTTKHLALTSLGSLFLLLVYLMFPLSRDPPFAGAPNILTSFSLSRNPFADLSAERWENEWRGMGADPDVIAAGYDMDGERVGCVPGGSSCWEWETRFYVPIPNTVALVFGERGTGKSTLRILAEQIFRRRQGEAGVVGDGMGFGNVDVVRATQRGAGWFRKSEKEFGKKNAKRKGLMIDITPEKHSLNIFFPALKHHMWHTCTLLQRIIHTPESYWGLEFDREFTLADFGDMVLARGISLIVDEAVDSSARIRPPAVRAFRLLGFSSTEKKLDNYLGVGEATAAQLGLFAATYYMGPSDRLETFLALLRPSNQPTTSWPALWTLFTSNIIHLSSQVMLLWGRWSVVIGVTLLVLWANFAAGDVVDVAAKSNNVLTKTVVEVLVLLWCVWRGVALYNYVASLGASPAALWSWATALLSPIISVRSQKPYGIASLDQSYALPPPTGPVDHLPWTPRPVRVVPPWQGREEAGSRYAEACRRLNLGWEGDSAMGRLKRFRSVVDELGVGEVAILVDGVDETSLSSMASYPRVLPRFATTVMDHALFELSMDRTMDTSFDTVGSRRVKEKGRLDKYGWIELHFDSADLIRIASKRFSAYQLCRNAVTFPTGTGMQGAALKSGGVRWWLWGKESGKEQRQGQALGFKYSEVCRKGFWDLFCEESENFAGSRDGGDRTSGVGSDSSSEKSWVFDVVERTDWLRTPR
ncbi:hypothetical protein HDU93_000617 [Gonapodya sp. JEL0774]|nr:hypothetical protein HDU93_000617 [Gonapodya sp. JEL0774]